MFCPKCGNEIKEGTRFCPKCGNECNHNQESASKNAQPNSKTNKPNVIKKQTIGIIIGVIAVMIIFVSFVIRGGSRNDKEEIELIKSSLEAQEYFQVNEYQIEDVKLISSKEDKKSSTKVDTCTIVFANTIVRYTTNFEFTFFKTADGWILQDYKGGDEENDKSEPVTGITEDRLKYLFQQEKLTVANTKWDENQIYPQNLTIDSRETDLKKGTDTVICSFELKSEYLTVNCNVKVDCKFKDIRWVIESVEDTGKSTLVLNDELNGYAKFSVSDDKVKEYVENNLYSGYDEDSRKKDQSYVKDNISNFKVVDKYYASKGGRLVYECTLDYHTAMADLNLTCYVSYYFQENSGWRSSSVDTTVLSATPNDLTGTWSGSTLLMYFYEFTQTLTIDSMDESGNFKGTYTVVKSGNETTTEDTFEIEGKFKFVTEGLEQKVEYAIDVADGKVSDGRVIIMQMNTNSESLSLDDSYANGVTNHSTSLTKQ